MIPDETIDRVLREAGERWRAAQPPVSDSIQRFLASAPQRSRGNRTALGGMLVAGIAVVLVVAVSIDSHGRRPQDGGPLGGDAAGSPTPSVAAPSRPVAGSPIASTNCPITTADRPFIPPAPFLRTPPAPYESEWYGSAHLFTMLDRVAKPKGPWLATDQPFPDKTFWWSADWDPQKEQQPAITVTGRRLDGPGAFSYGNPGTNASADFGTAMLVGIDYPSVGCWELTARYRDATLSYVIEVVD